LTTVDPVVQQTYDGVAGAFQGSVTVTDDKGATDSATFDFVLTEPGMLIAGFETVPLSHIGPAPFTVDAVNTSESGGPDILSLGWETTNGQHGSDESFSVTFNFSGIFGLTLTVEDEIGRIDTASLDIIVTVF